MGTYWKLIRTQWPLLLFGFMCVFWGNFGQSFLIGWFSEPIKKDLALSAQQYGSIYSVATLLSAASMLYVGGWIDRWPLKKFVVWVSIGLFCACVALALAFNVVILFIGFYLVRLFGQGLLPHTGMTSMAKFFIADRGKAISVASSAVSVGEIILPIVVILLFQFFNWQQSWLFIAISVIVIFLPGVLFTLKRADWVTQFHEPAQSSSRANNSQSGRKILFSDLRYWCAAPTILSVPFVLTAVFIHQDFIVSNQGWNRQLLAWSFIVYGAVHWVASLVFGVLVDRFSAVRILPFFSIPLILALFFLAYFDGSWVAIVMMIFFGVAIGASGPVIGSLWAEIYGTEQLGGVRSSAGAVVVLATAISPILIGWLIDMNISGEKIFLAMAICLIALLVPLRWSYR